ncbi:hypothetical protein N0V90_005124 [Kalmusia sp. IMI 367209]|nr:hypothetical protein N0V90_005124 [Kalmusia sp. IMI 367209]
MAAVQQAPISPMSAHAYPSVGEDASIHDLTHLSGMTLADFVKEPKIHLVEASPSSSKQRSDSPSMIYSKRSSRASTTKSQLRQTNTILVEMLQSIQTELATHRTIMLDIQHRVSHLEHESDASVNNDASQATLRALEGRDVPSKRNSKLLAPEASHWWQACQNFASNAEPPISAREFLRTPQRFSGFDFHWEAPNTPPTTPPEVDDLPPLTPASEEGDVSDLESPIRHDILLGEEMTSSTPKIAGPSTEEEHDIKEHTIEFDKKKLPAPPTLQPAPNAKPIVVEKEDMVAAIEPEVMGNHQRYFKGVRSLATYKALLKNKSTDKEHHVLIHFHRRKDVHHLSDA